MKNRQTVARWLVGLGCLDMLAGSILHLAAGYPMIAAALAASNLEAAMQGAARTVFLLIGFTWIVIAIVTLIAAFTKTRIRKAIVLLCGFALLVEIPIWVRIMGWFIGNEMFLIAGVLVICGGFAFPPVPEQ